MDSRGQTEQKTRIQLADEALENHDYIRALRYYTDAVQSEPYNHRILINLGFCYARTNNFAEAKKCFETALQLQPDNRVAKQNLSRINSARIHKTPGSGKKSIQIRPEEMVFIRYMQWGSELIKKENYFSALQFYREASGIHPDFVEPYKRIGYCYAKLHNYHEAAEAFQDALHIYQNDPVALDCLEKCKQRLSDYSPFISKEPPKQPVRQEMKVLSQQKPVPVDVPKSAVEYNPDDIQSSSVSSPDVSNTIATVPPQTDAKPATSKPKMSDDDLIAAILSQYSDEIKEETAHPVPEEPEIRIGDEGKEPISTTDQTDHPKQPENTTERENLNLTDEQMDALRELGNIGASHAATTLSTMLNTPIMLEVPEISISDLPTINTKLEQEDAALVYFKMEGEISEAGYVILHVPKESVIQMTSIMLGLPPDLKRDLDEMDESALNEIGNIMVSAFLDGTAELLGIIMLPSPPRILFDTPEALFHLIIDESNISYENVVFFKTEMQCDAYELTCNILMLPNPPVLHDIIRMLEKLIEDSLESGN